MAQIEWDKVDERDYEYGVDRCIIGIDGEVIPWPGLVSVTRREIFGTEVVSQFDGRPYANVQFGGMYQAKIVSLGFPNDALDIIGMTYVLPGFILTNQKRTIFDLCYRTMVNEEDYKLHIVYFCTLSRTDNANTTLTDSISISESEWTLDASTPPVIGVRPTSYLCLDSREADPEVMEEVQDLFYGTPSTDPEFPDSNELSAIFFS